jgi:molybdate transport system substrate-binding protein
MRTIKKLLLLCAFTSSFTVAVGQERRILIAAASDLKFALDSIVALYQLTHQEVRIDVSYGSSGKLFEQIRQSAPFDIYFSADITYPKQLAENGLTISEVQPYAVGRLALWSKKVNPAEKKMDWLVDPSVKKVAIANPRHAPYGRRAEEAMKYYRVYSAAAAKLVLGENISQTAQFVTTGAADIGVVALSLAVSPAMKKAGGSYYVIPRESHLALVQGYAVLKSARGKNDVDKFVTFFASQQALDILVHFGFEKPE